MAENFGVNPSFEQSPTKQGEGSYTNLVEDHAAQLMDELFQDLGFSREPSKQQQPSAASQLALAVKANELQDNLLIPYVEMDAILEPFYEADPAPAPVSKNDPTLRSSLLLGLAWGSFLGSVGLWAFTQFNESLRSPAAVQAAVPILAAAQPQDIAFATELSQTLQSAENSPPSPSISPIPTTPLPPISPIPQAAVAVPVALPSIAAPPFKSVGIDRKSPSLAVVKAKPPQTVALAALSNRLPVLRGDQSQAAPAFTPPNLPSSPAPQPLPMGRQAKAGVIVQGILDLGVKSAMLISRNGSTQNVRPGEVLDATGWVFMRVENGQAILQRGNETRAVSGGEQF
jgi:hypothetical protein